MKATSHKSFVRSLAYRAGRRLYSWARGEVTNDPHSNGEYWLLELVTKAAPSGALFLDVGANKGDWTGQLVSNLEALGKRGKVVAFEPCGGTRSMLEDRFGNESFVEVVGFGISDRVGEALFFSSGDGLGTNSLHPLSGTVREKVPLLTLDAFLDQLGWPQVTAVKVDVEGFDALALLGAKQALSNGKIDLIQFEYNWRWLLSGQSLKCVFELIEGLPYSVGKLAGAQLLIFECWHFELDRFFEGNYVLLRNDGPLGSLGTHATFDRSNVLQW